MFRARVSDVSTELADFRAEIKLLLDELRAEIKRVSEAAKTDDMQRPTQNEQNVSDHIASDRLKDLRSKLSRLVDANERAS